MIELDIPQIPAGTFIVGIGPVEKAHMLRRQANQLFLHAGFKDALFLYLIDPNAHLSHNPSTDPLSIEQNAEGRKVE